MPVSSSHAPRAVELLVIGAGPYGLSTGALAHERGVDTLVVGRPMGFWRDSMPAGMFLRSGSQWHIDAGGVHTLEAYLEERGMSREEVDPIPIRVFLDYCDWFRRVKGVDVREDLVDELALCDEGFDATLRSGEHVVARAVVCAPGIRHYAYLPDWARDVRADRSAHTCDLVRFDDVAGSRVLIVGGRQSAYEWAALIREHGAARVDIVHRHDIPRFEKISWQFVDSHMERTINVGGYWRKLAALEQEAIAGQFWAAGRLTLERWLTPRLDWADLHRWPGTEVVEVDRSGDVLAVRLSNSERLTVDRVVFASGYRADLTRVPYLAKLVGQIEQANGFPILDEAFATNLAGLYVVGFSSVQDFGPFFGFVRGCPAAATLVVRDLLSRN
jgi:cation diffusion facilitator CzcD-associated flavoprotein CzcO